MHTQSMSLTNQAGFGARPPVVHHHGRRGLLPFLGHFAQMVVAMVAGMAILYALLGDADISADVFAVLMAASMAAPMAAWMRIRGHALRPVAEMTATMVVPVAVLLPLFTLGLISDRALIGLEHVVMLPAMLAAMVYRRSEYGL